MMNKQNHDPSKPPRSHNGVQPWSKTHTVILPAFALSLLVFPKEVTAMGGGGGCVSGNIGISATITPLDFATITPCNTAGGSVSINASNGNLTTAGCVSGTSGAVQRASVTVTGGQASSTDKVVIRVPTGAVTISAGANTMTVTDIGLKQGGGKQFTVTMNGNKTKSFSIGGTVNVSAAQAGGSYSGVFGVTAECL